MLWRPSSHRQIRALVSLRARDSGVGIVRFGTAPGGHAGDRVARHITWISGRQFLTAVTVGDSRRWPYASWRPSRRAYRRQRGHEGDAAATAGHAAIGGLCPQRQRVGPRGLGGGGRRGGGGPPGAGPGCPVAGRVAGGGNDCPASWAAVLARWAGRGWAGGAGCAAVCSCPAAARAAAAWAACCWDWRSPATASASAASRVMSTMGAMDRSPVR